MTSKPTSPPLALSCAPFLLLSLLLLLPSCNAFFTGAHDGDATAQDTPVAREPTEPTPALDAKAAPEPEPDDEPRSPQALELGAIVLGNATLTARRVAMEVVPPLRDAAERRVHLAITTASLDTAWPLPGGEVSDKARARARKRRRHLDPGEIELIYPKASAHLKVTLFDEDGRMRPEAYKKICQALYVPTRDDRPIEQPWIDFHPRLLTMLYYAAQHFDAPIEVISGFRLPRRRGRGSNHTRGRAMDIRIKGESRRARRRVMAYFEKSFSRLGLGWYPRSTFIHVDTRPRAYYWTDSSRPGRRQRHRKRKIIRKPRPGTDPTADTIHLPLEKLYR